MAELATWPDPALIVDQRHTVVAANDRFRTQHSPDRDVVGLRCFDVFHGSMRPCGSIGEECPAAAARRTAREHRAVHVHASTSGTRCVDVLARPLDDRHAMLVVRSIEEVSTEPGTGKLTGRCPRFLDMVEQMRRVAPTDRPVLLVGEPGSGKELVARTIHAMSGRRSGPFVAVDCARSSDLLAQTDLFGISAIEGGTRIRGLVAAAEGGTLFLDDLEALPPGLQGPVLRLIESGTYRHVGAGEQRSVDVRVMCAAEHPLDEAVAAGRLRQDAGTAIACSITVPPLRARRDDIPLLTASLLARTPHLQSLTVHPRALTLLYRYQYPGNVRELGSILESASLAADRVILPSHLPPHVRR